MKKFVYPVILFTDAESKSYTVLFPDLDIVATGETVEEAYLEAEDYLKSYLEFANKMGSQVANASTFVETEMLNPKRKIMLAGAEISNSVVLTQEEKEYKNFVQKYLCDTED